ncbi:glycosyl transferase [Salpingoeca rosetta]|uniref:Glycosyl transferase n=1 Tax=Salpingoeca rosetta (strain ATCC 50818 / BSB-021) TaxID=946362 RepID=F2UAB7_SALR5|nr:glycosyl transferase [Salpingoeca rosetta]EGD73692.1 glycosyl transferase [Salpingoeca rosetta]|eukprot:XP_004993973.1 glycosyl transferase [Salpingoeca rosetta]
MARLSMKRMVVRAAIIVALIFAAYKYGLFQSKTPFTYERRTFKDYKGGAPWRMHGILGLRPDGTPGFPRAECPTNYNMAEELRSNGFFARLSDCLPLDRNITDGRHKSCRFVQYDLDNLPDTSVIFVFYNEHPSVLLRSIHSVLNRTPPQLLKEIILVDDGSDLPWLGQPLEEYVQLLPKVRIVRNEKRSGLVKARLRGVEESTAQTFTVLDSHIEVEEGWCEPLMARIKGDRTRVLMPQIDSINQETLDPVVGGIGCSLGFLWNLIEHSIPIQKKDQALRTTAIDAVRSPTMAGGLFTADREFFWHLGGYDTEFGFWGTENLEFSFRIWQCGGSLECMPCSRIHHIFRKGGHAYSLPPGHVAKNKLRTAAIWMDDYGFIVKEAIGAAGKQPDIGPLDHMLELKQQLQCKSFDWYLKNVYPEGIITDLSDIRALGTVKNTANNMCVDNMQHMYADAKMGAYACHGHGSQTFLILARTKEIRPVGNLELCLTSDTTISWCESRHDVTWDYDQANMLLKNTKTQKCLAVGDGNNLVTEDCDLHNDRHKWTFDDKHPDKHPAVHF